MTVEKIISILTKEKFQNPYAIEEYFKEFGFTGDMDAVQWDDVAILFESEYSNAYFVVHVDPYALSFYVNVYNNGNFVCCIFYDILVNQGRIGRLCEEK